MARNFKDHFGNASAANERILKTQEAKDRFSNEQIIELLPLAEQEKYCIEKVARDKEIERKKREEERIERDAPRMTPLINREEWLKNKAIIEAKARGDYEKPGKEKVEKHTKTIEIIQVLYGLQDIKLIDITAKVVVGQKVNNELVGEDPCPKKKKAVIVRAKVDGVEGDYTFTEGKKIVF